MFNNRFIVTICIFLLTIAQTHADTNSTVSFYASNNTKTIDMQTAYDRLTGKAQPALQEKMIDILQKNHIEQGRFKNILGTYQMPDQQYSTADNTEAFDTSPYQPLSNEKVFSIAQEMAIALKQDSVAVLVPNPSVVGDVTVNFTFKKPGIHEMLGFLQEKLPLVYRQSFSLHLANITGNFNDAKVEKIEWLGSQFNLDELQQAFPFSKITVRYGDAFLVHQNGLREHL